MKDYLYSQRFSAYAEQIIGQPNLKMKDFGCVITATAMILSYFKDKALYPDQWLAWLKSNKGLTADGRLYWNKLCEATFNQLRFSYVNKCDPGETTYTLRQVYFGRMNHWVLDSLTQAGMIIDPFDGRVKPYSSYNYSGQHRYFFGKR